MIQVTGNTEHCQDEEAAMVCIPAQRYAQLTTQGGSRWKGKTMVDLSCPAYRHDEESRKATQEAIHSNLKIPDLACAPNTLKLTEQNM
jgi:predicted dinucleotide-binding enzyme